jgi:hypothetical protein
MMLIRTYRVRGHLAAELDPLGLSRRELPGDLTPEYHGFTGVDLDRPVYLGGTLGLESATVREIVEILRQNYCGHIGLEYMPPRRCRGAPLPPERMEGRDAGVNFTPEGKKAILAKVIEAEQWEKFLGRKYVGTKRFGLDGGESMIPALENIIKYGGAMGVREIVIGMSHRGRLNVLANVMQKPYRAIFSDLPAAPRTRGCRRVGRRQISSRHVDRPRVRRQPGPSEPGAQSQPSGSGRPRSCSARRAPSRPRSTISHATRCCRSCCMATRIRGPRHRHGCFGFRACADTIPAARSTSCQQPGRVHHEPAIRAIVTLSVRHRQDGAGADPARERR